ncbi:MAG: HDOD domain-containing protein [Desulfobacteraceae bacterium]|nr:HDOD domain-containing protein [Desulfobacteraceae bacterium]
MKTLIIDDAKISRKVIQKIMEPISECQMSDDGKKGFAIYEKAVEQKKPFDLLTLDVSMPGVSGLKVLNEIRRKEQKMKISKAKKAKIIMVTSRMDTATIKKCIKLGCNGYLTKPINKYLLLKSLEGMGFDIPEKLLKKDKSIHKDIVENIIKKFYQGKINIPVLPHIIQAVNSLFESDDASIEGLAKIVEKDPVICSKLISIANSPLYKGVDIVDNLNSGLVRLGLKAAHSTILTITNKNIFNSKNNFVKELLEKLWMHSFACACCGKLIAEELKLKNSETIFLMGIIHDIGKLLLIKAIVDINPDESFKDDDLLFAIQEIHTTFGGALLKKWKFSNTFIQIAELHHWSNFSAKREKDLLIINLANNLAKNIGFDFFNYKNQKDEKEKKNEGEKKMLKLLKKLGLEHTRFVQIGEEAKTTIKESARAF